MPAAHRHDVPIAEAMDGYEGRFMQWGDLTAAFEKIPGGLDLAPLLAGLPDDLCQCPHWGILQRGRILVRYVDREEVIEAGQAYYMAPGHAPLFELDSETLEFSPTEELEKTFEAIRRNIELVAAE